MEYLELFILLLLVFYVVFKLFYRYKLKKSNNINIFESAYFIYKFKLDREKINFKEFLSTLALLNTFIISFVTTLVFYLDIELKVNYFIELIIGFILLMLLIYSIYEIYGRKLKKKWR